MNDNRLTQCELGGGFVHEEDSGELGTKCPRVSIAPEEAWILKTLAYGRRVLEIGTGLGVSTGALAHYAQQVVTVDIDPWVAETIAPTLPHNVEFRVTFPSDLAGFDMVFIDGLHDAASVAQDLKNTMTVCRLDALVVLHNWKHKPVRQAVKDFGLPAYGIDTHYGLGIVLL